MGPTVACLFSFRGVPYFGNGSGVSRGRKMYLIQVFLFLSFLLKQLKKLIISSTDKTVEQLEISYIAGRRINWCKHFETPFGSIY